MAFSVELEWGLAIEIYSGSSVCIVVTWLITRGVGGGGVKIEHGYQNFKLRRGGIFRDLKLSPWSE